MHVTQTRERPSEKECGKSKGPSTSVPKEQEMTLRRARAHQGTS